MSQPLRVAFVGVDHPHGAGWRGSIAQVSEFSLTALVPEFPGSIHSLEERHAQLPRFESLDELLAKGATLFDAAVVTLPNDRAPQAIATLAAAGKHVLVEKPAGGSAPAIREAMEAVQRSGVAFQSGYLWRYDELANRLRAMIADGRFGKLISIEMTCVTSDIARRGEDHYLFDAQVSGGGFFNWLGCHYLDLLPYVTGQDITGVTARVGVFGATPTAMEDGGTALLDLSGGGLATFTGGYWLPRWTGEWRWTLRGSERWVNWEPNRPGTGGVLEIHGPQPQFHAMEEVFTLPPNKVPGYGGVRTLALLREWAAAARGEVKSCRNTPRSTLATLGLIDTVYAASKQGRRLPMAIG
jgi:predicted dehydrogenase